VVCGYTQVDLEGRFFKIRTGETNLSNMIVDVIRTDLDVDLVLLNSGTLRLDNVIH